MLQSRKHLISCLICTCRESSFIDRILSDLKQQSPSEDLFEVLILDNSKDGLPSILKKYGSIRVFRDHSTQGFIGAMRNCLLSQAQGKYILFLDDDTQIHQKDFIYQALEIFKTVNPDIILPRGKGLARKDKPGYHYLDMYSFATRCCLYKKSLFDKIGLFRADITAYEDIDLGIRMTLQKARILKTPLLEYYHPVHYFKTLQKPLAIGQSIFKLRNYYPWYWWILIYLNALRFLPLVLLPTTVNRQWFKISLGVLIAPFFSKRYSYQSSE